MGKSVVVYYSWLGHTKVVAEEIAKQLDCDLKRIEEVKERNLEKAFGSSAMSAMLGLKSRLKPMDFSMSNYETVFLGMRVWAGRSTPPMNAFLSKADFKGKKVHLFITKADPKIPQKVVDSVEKRIIARGGQFGGLLTVTTTIKEPITAENVGSQIDEWIKGL